MNHPDALLSMQASQAPAGEQAGLMSAEAARRLAQFGPNSVAAAKESAIRTFLEQLWAPVAWMLEAAVVVQIVLGEDLEAAVSAAFSSSTQPCHSSSAAALGPPWIC